MKINERITGGVMAVALMGFIAGGLTLVATAAPEPTPAAETSESIDLDAYPDTNGMAAEQEAEAAAAEQARIAAEAEAARIAAEQAAAQAEADRIAAEQAAAEAESYEAESYSEPAPEPEPEPEPEYNGPDPDTQSHAICEVLDDGTQVPCQH